MKNSLNKSIYYTLLVGMFFVLAGFVYAASCWDKDGTSSTECEEYNIDGNLNTDDCWWDEWGKYCMEKGCWDYWNEAVCTAANESGCFWQTESNMGWNTGMCEETASCWNYWNSSDCSGSGLGCQWKNASCQGPPGCEALAIGTDCDNSFLGCWSDYGDYCYRPGCWDYKSTATCNVDANCNWSANSYCTELGSANCWDYYNRTGCENVDCTWESYGSEETDGNCHEKWCGDYDNDETKCINVTKCSWNNESEYCYEKSCWNYWDAVTCGNNSDGILGNCQWRQSTECREPNCGDIINSTTCNSSVGCYYDGSSCQYEGCWSYNTPAGCGNVTTGCQWKTPECRGGAQCPQYSDYDSCENSPYACWWDSGDYCQELYCSNWDYTNSTICENDTDTDGLDCSWDPYNSYCNNKWCSEYTELSCNNSITGNCYWSDNWCQEKSCWGYSSSSSCTNMGCSWENWTYCEQSTSTSCYDINQSECVNNFAYNSTCTWDSYGSFCTERGCWDLQDSASCLAANLTTNCQWTVESGGMCEESGVNCWDYWIESDCISNNCSWDGGMNTCSKKGCWNYWINTTCDADSNCEWKTSADMKSNWGWCEKEACWNWDNTNASGCINNTFNLTCAWDGTAGGWCMGPWQNNCWEHDTWWAGGGNITTCVTENGTTGINCTWQAMTGWCYESQKNFSDFNNEGECLKSGWGKWNGTHCETSGVVMQNPGCWIFDGQADECAGVRGCTYNASVEECNGLDTVGIQCENITSVQVNNQTNQTLCEVIPMLSTCCKWLAGSCKTTYDTTCWDQMADPPEGGTHCMDYNAVDSPTICSQIAGDPWYMPCTWNNVSGQCQFKGDMATDIEDIKTKKNCEFLGGTWKTESVCGTDDCPSTKTWCEMETGSSLYGCDMSCWACNSSATCRQSSKGYCQWVVDTNLDQGGYCDIPNTIELHGDCGKFCGSCEFYSGGRGDNVYTPERACGESEAQCSWDNKTQICVQKKTNSCSDDCFYCFDKTDCSMNGGGSQGICKWDDITGICKPADFDKEICFDGVDNDNNDLVDCNDPICMFDPFCGGGDMSTCWMYMDNASCASNDCMWFQDSWTQGYRCGMKGENCWVYEGNSNNCNADPYCKWYSESHCEINHTKADGCFRKTTQTACTSMNGSYCKWQTDSYSPQGGWCDFAVFECHWNESLRVDKSSCEGNNFCRWVTDTYTNEGWCEPKCFARDSTGADVYNTQASCNGAVTGGLCEWSTGWCEPNSSNSVVGVISERGCAAYDNNMTVCDEQPGCAWFEEFMAPTSAVGGGGGGFVGSQCGPKYSIDCWMFTNQSNCNTSYRNGTFNSAGDGDACRWVQDGTWAWCDQIGMHCGPMHAPFCVNNICYDVPQINTAACSADSYCELSTYANYSNGSCTPICMNSTNSVDITTCEANSYCTWMGTGAGGTNYTEGPAGMQHGGWCDPVGSHTVFQNMEKGAPHPLGSDSQYDAPNNWTDIMGFGIKDLSDNYGFGIGIQSMVRAAVCNGETLWDGNTGIGYKATKGWWYLDADGAETGGCRSDNGAFTGFEFKLIAKWEWSNDGLKESLIAKRCSNGNWTAANLRLQTHTKKMCQEMQGMVVTVSINDLVNFPSLYNPIYPMRIYVVTGSENNTAASPADSVDAVGYYMSGTVDFKVEDCTAIGNIDMDGDGFYAYEDPDCKHIYMDEDKGFKAIEDCKTAQDDDMNGLTNCDDPACKDELVCGGDLTVDTTDHTTPKIKQIKEHEHKRSADIEYTTDERSNGTFLFYGTDSSYSLLNATIRDKGLWNENNTNYQKYKFKHKAPIDNLSHTDALNYSLDNATTYYYKIKFCDISGNCGLTGGLNFTTKALSETKTMKFTDPDASDSWLIDINGSYEQQGGGCALTSNNSGNLGEVIDPEVTPDISIQQTKTTTGGNSVTVGIGGIDTAASQTIDNLDMEIGEVTGHESGATEDYVWINESGWGGNDGLYSQGAPDNVTIVMPGSGTHLYDCEDKSGSTLVNCTDITDYATRSYSSGSDETTWVIPDPTAELWSYIVPQTPSTTTTPPPPGGSTGGGGGGAAAAATNVTSVSHFWGIVAAGSKLEMAIINSQITITLIEIKVKNALTDFEIKVDSYDTEKPSAVSEFSGTAYQYLEITKKNAVDDDITSATISFSVTKLWVTDTGVEPIDVILYRYVNDKWEKLVTKYVGAEGEKHKYEVTIPGFSFFLVGIEKAPVVEEEITGEVVEEVAPPTEIPEEVAPPTEIPEEVPKKAATTWILWVILMAVVIVAGVIYFVKRKSKK